ncbi:MAG: transposase [Geminicoccales bacterium]
MRCRWNGSDRAGGNGCQHSRQVCALFGLTPKRYQPGEKEVSGRISKISDRGLPMALYEAAHIILTRPVKTGALKSWAMRLAACAGKNKTTEQRVWRQDQSSTRGWTNHRPLQKSIS